MVQATLQCVPSGDIVGVVQDIHKLLEVRIVAAEFPISLAQLVQGQGCGVLFVGVSEMPIQGCQEVGKAVEEDLIPFLSVFL